MPAAYLRPAFLPGYIFDSDCGAEAQHGAGSMRKLDVRLMQQLAEMLHKVDTYIQTLKPLRECVLGDSAVCSCQMVLMH